MGARGDLRHHAAKGRVLVDLRQHDIGQDLAAAVVAAARPRRRRSRRRWSRFRVQAFGCSAATGSGTGVALRGPMAQSSRTTAILRIGTRGIAAGAGAGANGARRAGRGAWRRSASGIEIVVIRTTGDRIQDRPLAEAGGKGLFTKEIEEALLAGAIDLAVHSAKDMPTLLPDGLVIAACLPREDARDAFISRKAAIAVGACRTARRVGTASLRRQAQVKRLRPDLRSCRCAAMSKRGCASSMKGDATRPSGACRPQAPRPRTMPRPRSSSRRISCRRSGRAPSASRRASDDAGRATLLAADQSCRRPLAALARRARLPRACSTAPAARRSPAMRRSSGERVHFAA